MTLPQAISTSSSVTFQDLTVNGTFTAANINISTAPTIAGKLLFLAANATSNSGISGGGIVLGPLGNAFTRSFTYDLAADKWDTDGAGLNTLELSSDNLIVTNGAHFGNAYNDYDFPNSAVQIDGNENTYIQSVIKNHSIGSLASADFVAVNNLGDDTSNYIDMGINSSTYNNADYSITGPNDGYLYVSDGDLVVGTATNGKEIVFFTGGTTSDKQRASISDSGLSTIELAVYGNTNITGNTTVANISVTNNLTANIGNFTSLAVTNTISGTVANGVVTTGSYANPSWITSLAGAKISGFVANAVYANIAANGVVTTGSYANPSWITSLAGAKITGFVANAEFSNATANGVVTTGSYSNPSWITGLAGDKITGFVANAAYANIAANGVVTTGSYSNPAWITSLAGDKITGFVANAAFSNTTANGVVTTGSYANPSWITSLSGDKITGFVANAISANIVTNGVYTTDTGTVTNTMLSGNITNSKLSNSSVVINTDTGLSGGGELALGGELTLVNIDPGSSQYIFKTINVLGQANITATVNDDSLNMISGTGILITTSGKNVTFTANVTNAITSITAANNIILNSSTGNVIIQRVDGLQTVVSGNTSSTYSITSTDQYFGSTRSTVGACTVTLPLGSSVPMGRQYIIKDEGGYSGLFGRRITVTASGSDTIDGSATRTITSNYGALTVLWTGTKWSVI